MSQILPFRNRRPTFLRRSPALRLAALLIFLLFAAAVVWTAVASLGRTCLAPAAPSPFPHSFP